MLSETVLGIVEDLAASIDFKASLDASSTTPIPAPSCNWKCSRHGQIAPGEQNCPHLRILRYGPINLELWQWNKNGSKYLPFLKKPYKMIKYPQIPVGGNRSFKKSTTHWMCRPGGSVALECCSVHQRVTCSIPGQRTRLWVWSLDGVCIGGNRSMFLLLQCLPASLPLSLPLPITLSKYILGWGLEEKKKKKKKYHRLKTTSNYFGVILIDSLVIPNGKSLDLKAYYKCVSNNNFKSRGLNPMKRFNIWNT